MISNNDMETKIARAREFANKSLIGYDPSVANKDDYFMFQISKFLLLKESMIKKDSDNNKIYFNIVNNYRYFKIIRCIVDYFRKYGGVLISNDIEVVIEPSNYTLSSELKSYILDFHRIRDSIAHGGYHIDSSGGYIVFDNNNLDSVHTIANMYAIKGKLPIEILELFTYISNSPKDIYSENEIDGFIANVKTARKQYGYNVEEKNIYNIIKEYNNFNNELFEYGSKEINIDTYNEYNDKYEYKNDDEIIIKTVRRKEEILQQLIKELINDKKYSVEQKNQFFSLLQKYGLVEPNTSMDVIITSKQPSKSYLQELEIVIDEISSIIKMKNNFDDAIKVSSVYNYMQLFLSFNHESINPKNKKNLGALKISKINPKYIGNNPEYEQIIQAIRKYVKENIIDVFITKEDEKGEKEIGKLEQYAKYPSKEFRDNINILLIKHYNKLLGYLASRNTDIITSIRNSLEHGNVEIEEETGNMKLHDQSNQKDSDTINFECVGSPSDFYELISCIDLDIEQDFSEEDFMAEMQEVLEKDMFDKFKKIFESIKKINAEAIACALKQAATKKK